jgi:hypothetical protein
MFMSRPLPHGSRAECGGTPEALGAREIIGDALFAFQEPEAVESSFGAAISR